MTEKSDLDTFGYTKRYKIINPNCATIDSFGKIYYVKDKKLTVFSPLTDKDLMTFDLKFLPIDIKVNSLGTKLLIFDLFDSDKDKQKKICQLLVHNLITKKVDKYHLVIPSETKITKRNFSFDMTNGDWLIFMPGFDDNNFYILDPRDEYIHNVKSNIVVDEYPKDCIVFQIDYDYGIKYNDLVFYNRDNLYFDQDNFKLLTLSTESDESDQFFGSFNYFQQIKRDYLYTINNSSGGYSLTKFQYDKNNDEWENIKEIFLYNEDNLDLTDQRIEFYGFKNSTDNIFSIDPLNGDLFIIDKEFVFDAKVSIIEYVQSHYKLVKYAYSFQDNRQIYRKVSEIILKDKGIGMSLNGQILMTRDYNNNYFIYLKNLDNNPMNTLGRKLLLDKFLNPTEKILIVEDKEGNTRKYDFEILNSISLTIKNFTHDNPDINFPLSTESYNFTLDEFESTIKNIITQNIKDPDNYLVLWLDIIN